MKDIDCQLWSPVEIATILKEDPVVFSDEKSRNILATWLLELDANRRAMYNARVALANPDAVLVLPSK